MVSNQAQMRGQVWGADTVSDVGVVVGTSRVHFENLGDNSTEYWTSDTFVIL